MDEANSVSEYKIRFFRSNDPQKSIYQLSNLIPIQRIRTMLRAIFIRHLKY